MREWNLKPGDPLSLTLAADIRLAPSDYYNDHIWELSLGGGEPPALALQTTFGLRARSLRLFPRFTLGDETRSDPNSFASPPAIKKLFPNFLTLTFAPFEGLQVIAEYWIPQSHAAAGRLQIHNSAKSKLQLQVEWVGQLSPTEGQRLALVEMQAALALSGSTAGLSPVVFLTGGPKAGSGSYPSLALSLELAPSERRQFTWAQAALSEAQASFDLARSIAAQNWEAERTRLEMLNAGQIDIYTGDPQWDSAFMLAQKVAYSLFVGPTEALPYPSYVQNRLPDQGFSLRGDGSDYNHLWNGQTPLEAYYLASLILPAAPDLARGLLRNFLAVQEESGFIDWKPGLGGTRGGSIAPPLLSSLAWRIYQATEEIFFLEDSFDALLKFLMAWFTPERDRDGDGIPEWDQPMQAGIEDHPLYSRWHDWSLGVDISVVESPALCALLYRECHGLIQIASLLQRHAAIPPLQELAGRLQAMVDECWSRADFIYLNRERDTHHSQPGAVLASASGSGSLLIQRQFDQPARLQLIIHTAEPVKPQLQLSIHGDSASGHHRVERLSEQDFKWLPGRGYLTGGYVYKSIEKIEALGLAPEDQISAHAIGYNFLDHTLLAPLWAGLPGEERARQLVQKTIANPDYFWQPYGLPTCPRPPGDEGHEACSLVNLCWNDLVGEGLLRYGYRSEAAELVIRLMNAVIASLKQEGAFRRAYRADSGQGSGDRNALGGLAPLGLFLDTLGVRLISPRRVALEGCNPFPWAVTVKYRGLTVVRQNEKTIVIFPDGQTVNIDDPAPRIVSLE